MNQNRLILALFMLILFCAYNPLSAQNNPDTLYNQARSLIQTAPDSANKLLDQAAILCNTPDDDLLLSKIWVLKSYRYSLISQLDSALIYSERALNVRLRLGDSTLIAHGLRHKGNLERQMGYEQAAQTLLHALQYARGLNDTTIMADTHQDLGNYYLSKAVYSEAELHYLKALNYAKGNLSLTGGLYTNLGGLYLKQDNIPKALENIEKAVLLAEASPDKAMLMDALFQKGAVYTYAKETDSAIKYLKQVQPFFEAHQPETATKVYLDLGVNYLEMGNDSEAKELFQKALNYEVNKSDPDPENLLTAHLNLAEYYEKTGDSKKALYHYQQYQNNHRNIYEIDLVQRVNGSDKAKELTFVNGRYQILKEQVEAQTKQINWGIAILIILGIGFFISSLFLRIKQKDINLKEEKIDNLLSIQEIKTLSGMIKGQEDERGRIGRDLHESVQRELIITSRMIEATQKKVADQEVSQKLREILDKMDQTNEEVRNISRNLVSGLLKYGGLTKAIRQMTRETEQINSAIRFEIETENMDQFRMIATAELQVYRIAQELTNNVLKHAQATKVNILLEKIENHTFKMIYADNGVGFDPEKNKKGIGIKNIEARLHDLMGSMDIESDKELGTTITIEIPINEET